MSNLEFDKKPSEFVLEGFKPYGLIPKLKVRLRDFPDSEPAQAILRIVILFCLTLIFVGASLARGEVSTLELLLASYLFIAIVIFISIAVSARPSPLRRVIANVLDIAYTSICMILSPLAGGFLYWVYLFVTIGNGYRFGQRYLFISQILSIAGFTFVLALVPRYLDTENFWQTLGMLTGLILIPTYVRNFHTREQRIRAKLIEARHHADAASLAKTRFLAMMSHEMRTPLNGVSGSCDMLAKTTLDIEQGGWVQIARTCSNALLSLINNVLDVSKIEASKLTLEDAPFDLHKLIESVVEIFEAQLVDKSVRLVTSIDPKLPFALIGDEQRLRQVLVNLVGNALKFTHEGEVVLDVARVDDDDNGVSIKFSIIDTGIGIPDAKQDRIFESFTQADDSTTRRYGGTGLGTTISQQLVELMGGELLLVSAVEKGTIFWFEIRLRQSIVQPHNLYQQEFSGAHILLVNFSDEEAIRLRALVGTWGFIADSVDNLADCYLRLRAKVGLPRPYMAVLINALDLDTDVVAVAKRIKGNGANAALRLLLANSQDTLHPAMELSKAGFSSLLDSPFDTRYLFNALHSVLPLWGDRHTSTVVPLFSRATSSEDPNQEEIRILLADDDTTNQIVISSILKSAGYTVDIVSDGEQALKRLEHQDYEIALFDLRMPVMSGIEAVKFYNFTEPENPPKFILLTADILNDVREEAMSAGIVQIVHKPVSAEVLLDVVHRWVKDAGNAASEVASGLRQNPDESLQSSTESKILDHNVIEALVNLSDDASFLKRLVRGYSRDGEALLLEFASLLRQYQNSEDRGPLARISQLAHALKGSSAQIGLMPLSRLAAELQQDSLETLSTSGWHRHETLTTLFDQSVQELQLQVSNRKANKNK